MMKRAAVRMSVLFLCLLCAFPLFAQSADVSGTVTDQSGAVVPGAKVRLVNELTLIEHRLTTNGQGIFSAPFVDPGSYQVYVEAPGFAIEVIRDVKIDVAAKLNLPIHLQIGKPTTTVTVDSSTMTINTVDASVSTVIDRKFVENMPLNGRSFQDLIAMTPGVVTQSPQASTQIGVNGDFSVNGQRTESNYYMVDGVSGNVSSGNGLGTAQPGASGSLASSTALGTTQSLLSVDAMQEFRVESSTYSAEYGRSPGGQFSFNTRSGTDIFHGSAFDYLRNDALDANDWFNNHYEKPITALRQNDFGGTLGGPIRFPFLHQGENKTFFFFSYEGLRLDQPQAASIQYVPDLFLRQQAPAALQPILNAYPLPNGIDYGTAAAPSLAQFIAPFSAPAAIDSTSIRIDQTATSKLKLFFRFGNTPSSTSTNILSALATTHVSGQSYTFGATWQISPRVVNDFRLGYAKSTSTISTNLTTFGGASPTNFAELMGAPTGTISGQEFELSFAGIGNSLLEELNSANQTSQWNITDSANISLGRHQVKFGIDYRRVLSPILPTNLGLEAFYFSPQAVISGFATEIGASKALPAYPLFHQFAAYVQDEWHVNSRLNASVGVRWEVNPPPTGSDGNDAYTVNGNISNPSSLTVAPQGTPLWKTTWLNFAPRLGVAWVAHSSPSWETVIRTGGGVFFDNDNESAVNGFRALGFGASKTYVNQPLPVTPAQLNFTATAVPPYTNAGIYAFPTHLQLPYTLEWNASLEQAFGKAQTLTISYVGSNGRRLMDAQLFFPPGFDYLQYFPSGVTSNYQALQTKFQRSVAHGVQALVSYTWSHALDFGSTAEELPLNRGNADFDVRNNFQGGLSWDLPHSNTSKLLSSVIDNWGLDGRLQARSSFPISLLGNLAVDPATGTYYYGGLNYNPSVPLYLRGCSTGPTCNPGGRAINSAAFSIPASGAGNAPRNFVRGFDATQINLATRRDFHLFEGTSLQFRAEMFNILNHPNFGFVDPAITDATFGQATQMLNQSLGTVSALYQQGGSRSVQFSLKLKF